MNTVLLLLLAFAPSAHAGRRVEEFKILRMGDSRRVSSAELMGNARAMLLTFSSMSCEPCFKEIPVLEAFMKRQKGKVNVFLVMTDSADPKAIAQWASQNSVRLPILLDPDQEMKSLFRVKALPTLFLLRNDGDMLYSLEGAPKDLPIEAMLEQQLRRGTEELTIVYTGNANGNLGPCRCADKPPGGFGRRASAIEEARKSRPNVLVLDAGGNITADTSARAAEAFGASFLAMRYDALGVGASELAFGIAGFKRLARRNLPYILSNAYFGNAPYLEPKLIKDMGPFKAAIASYMEPKVSGKKRKSALSLYFDPAWELQPMIDGLRKKADIVILIAAADMERTRELVKELRGVDVVLSGHSQELLPNGEKIGKTMIISPGADGEYVGKLTVSFGRNSKIRGYENEIVALDADIPEDARIAKLIQDAQKPVPEE